MDQHDPSQLLKRKTTDLNASFQPIKTGSGRNEKGKIENNNDNDDEDNGNRDPKEPEPLNSRMNKLRFAFQLYDLDRDGKISRQEMLQVLRLMVGVQVTEEQLESIADRTVQEADEDGDGAVSFLEFAKSLEKMNIEQKMSIRILK
ncbi:hypothetical protein E2I00_011440 [Balaenoptera physalus]|uniref:EF-hand domain-containing protein n=1 Tax=Balaenoptera physalus TaxID=9770 RepID=A0A643BZ51_BALPH|nr:hypothetical protein E2I00_011440 [Balaenoptera physalus]